jgi:hypothetical protein
MTRTVPPRPRHARELRDRELRPGDVVERSQRARKVERRTLEREVGDVPFQELDVCRRPLACGLEQRGGDVDADDLAHQRCEGESQRPRARSGVERALVPTQRHEPAHPGRERFRALVLPQGPALRNRRQRAWPGPARC